MTDIRLYLFQTGHIRQQEVDIKMGASQDEFITPIPWFLITHPKGNIIIDGGTPVEAAIDPHKHWGTVAERYFPLMKEEDGCLNRFVEAGFDPKSVRYVLHSHLHIDHTGALGHFPNATYIVQRREYEFAYAPDWFSRGAYVKADFDRPGLKWHFLEGQDHDGFDLYGDGTVKFYFTPGHSPGHQSFLLNLPNSGAYVLTIDAAYTMDHWNEKCLPGSMTSAIEVARSVQKLRMIADVNDATIITGHDPDMWPTLKKFPEYYG
ncbi:MBL fold metallo-hydrolase [Rhizobium lusitanum]|uniref:quorum-quenching N-acyl-homoserine lactonase n=1 Tax=Rhizobium lusitanum TaxID=293958 RepID=A0A6L9UCR2_9HYPH|nr:N-acyl homoserine lactonase family protein [Rhizobium lusitanum]NEI73673.1 MBL fold metallo-hydrolase [Rhizobium lusitanum]